MGFAIFQQNLTNGAGFIAIALVYFGAWRPTGIMLGALLFLAAGSVIIAMHHEQDMLRMGNLKKKLKQTKRLMWVGVLAIAGLKKFFTERPGCEGNAAAILSGANVNFARLRHIAERAAAYAMPGSSPPRRSTTSTPAPMPSAPDCT